MKATPHPMSLKRIAAAVALLGCAAALPVLAQSGAYDRGYNPSWYVMPSILAMDPDSDFTGRRGEGGALRLGKPVSPSWDIQFGPTFARSHEGSTTYRQNTVGVDALYFFSRGRLRPFVLVGAGAQYDKVSRNNLRADQTSPYVSAGIGVQYAFGERWGMQADLRRSHAWLRGDEFGFSRSDTDIVNVGLTYAFDRPAPVRAARAAPPVESPAPVVAAAPAPMPPPMAMPAAAPARFEKVTLSSTELFAFDSATLRLPQPKLDEIADVLRRNSQIDRVTITGYTDRLGSDAYNRALSQRRADAVKSYLTGKSIAAARLETLARGEENPVVQCNDRKRADLIVCLEPNRRVEVGEFVVERRLP